MAVTSEAFLVEYPEFGPAESELVEGKLAAAARRVGIDTWGDRYEDAVYVLAAHLLAISPFGQQARLSSSSAESTYGRTFEEMRVEATFGYRI
jgi:hypothetical protein